MKKILSCKIKVASKEKASRLHRHFCNRFFYLSIYLFFSVGKDYPRSIMKYQVAIICTTEYSKQKKTGMHIPISNVHHFHKKQKSIK